MTVIIDGTNGITPAQWTTAGRPSSPIVGQSGWNTTTGAFEIYVGSSTWQSVASLNYSANYLVVAGGGGGGAGLSGASNGAGGGAGGILESVATLYKGTTYTITAGSGGASNTSGSNSVISSVATAIGGGSGGGGVGTVLHGDSLADIFTDEGGGEVEVGEI